ncbi:MAG: hypothetical protein Q9163_006090 [Psora crenata]
MWKEKPQRVEQPTSSNVRCHGAGSGPDLSNLRTDILKNIDLAVQSLMEDYQEYIEAWSDTAANEAERSKKYQAATAYSLRRLLGRTRLFMMSNKIKPRDHGFRKWNREISSIFLAAMELKEKLVIADGKMSFEWPGAETPFNSTTTMAVAPPAAIEFPPS